MMIKAKETLDAISAEIKEKQESASKEVEELLEKKLQSLIAVPSYNSLEKSQQQQIIVMDANGYNAPKVVSPASGQTRPEILQDAMGGTIDDELKLSDEEKILPEAKLYRRLLIAVCNQKNSAMPFLFERIADYSELLLPDDLLSEQSFVTDIRNGMSDEDCQNVELMGWLYQFYIVDRKADAEVKKTKKGGLKSDEQAAATQLFTPHWVVRYMVENSLGKIWMTLHPESSLIHALSKAIDMPCDIIQYIQIALNGELNTIESLIKLSKYGAEKYSNTSSPTFELRQSEHSFALVLQEFTAELECIVFWIKKLINTLAERLYQYHRRRCQKI